MSATANEPRKPYLLAMGHDRLLPLYDPLQRLLGMESVHRQLVDQARIQPDQRILEIGCGTGNLAILIKRLHPGAEVIGIDPDSKALARAQRKAGREALTVQLDRGFAEELPYPDASFDRVLSALMFHHLETEEKEKALDEARRVLKPGGSLHCLTSEARRYAPTVS
jgi:ubiquinone/menaquinone biosynthesis C-methylase UbiE